MSHGVEQYKVGIPPVVGMRSFISRKGVTTVNQRAISCTSGHCMSIIHQELFLQLSANVQFAVRPPYWSTNHTISCEPYSQGIDVMVSWTILDERRFVPSFWRGGLDKNRNRRVDDDEDIVVVVAIGIPRGWCLVRFTTVVVRLLLLPRRTARRLF